MREAASVIESRDPAECTGCVATPLELAHFPDCVLAQMLRPDVERHLDWVIDRQEPDGSWAPSWTWGGAYPEAWAVAERWWRGDVTLQTLRSLRAYGRIEGA